MPTYAIGDVQGCLRPLRDLLKTLDFRPDRDRLWFVGDLVNRGPDSLGVLRFVRDLGDTAVTVLGNHDLHLLAMAHGNRKHDKADPGMHAILRAADCDALLEWLLHRPLLHDDPRLNLTMVHAGISPQWDRPTAMACARDVEATLRGEHAHAYFHDMYGNRPDFWDDNLKGMERLRYATNTLTRIRFCRPDGRLDMAAKTDPNASPRPQWIPWFRHPTRKPWDSRIIFGHWSTLGYHQGHGVYAIDTGCVWGGSLTALRLDGLNDDIPRRFSLDCETFRSLDG